MGLFRNKTQEKLLEAQKSLTEASVEMNKDIEELKMKQSATDARLNRLETQQDSSAEKIGMLQKTLDDIRDSAIRGEIASGQRTKDVANKFNVTPSRISQIAPRRKYSNG